MTFRDGLRVVEHVSGVWSYHLAEPGKYKSLCDKPVMNTGIPLTIWGYRSKHIPEKWCSRCAELGQVTTP